ncbi:four helix bundle protein [Winogradskyella immobilis]|uniref:Four helix bundle protein n=1 Tax=Winogradskyella immobilis TaxID=2816852 RepID=A0ABS8ELJ9_9FLAO|nr:four helix bundle protein [Winogradskyella immobilis]MCC1483902.1 four helix bundle protein [Winogradskyella immobilis]MCG0015995.1 four helix bundle protein [Winogradskyella immobilis]
MKANELEKRLIQFSIDIILLCKTIDKSFASEHLAKQLIRSATSSALNYGEARSGESTRDFLHKMKICSKELRESFINLKIMKGANLISDMELLEKLSKENNELISIFVSSIKTASNKLK